MKAQTKSVQIVKPLTRQGRSYVRGDQIEVTPTEALALRRQGFVTLTRGAVVERPPDPEPEPEQTTRRRRRRRNTYQTRDMVVDRASPDPEPVEEPSEE